MKNQFSNARVLRPWIVVATFCVAAIQMSVAGAPTPAIQVLNNALPSGVNGLAYQAKLYASGGVGPYTWALLPGSVLPTGNLFQFSSGGVLSGTPTNSGNYSIVVQATDANGKQGSRSYTLTISNSGITTTSLPSGIKGAAYKATLSATGGMAPYSWATASGSAGKLPNGLSMNSSGNISGTPGTLGYQEFTVRATDSKGLRFSQTLGINTVMPLTVSGSALPTGTIGRSYKTTLGASGGQAPYTWKVVAGTPPSIIGVDTTGTVSGTPTETGSYGFTVQASDASGQQVKTAASIAITGPLAIVTTSLPGGKAGALYSVNVVANGGLAPYSWKLAGGMLPPGLVLSALGGVSGTPTTPGSFTFTLQVLDSGGGSTSQAYTVAVIPGATISITPTSVTLSNLQTQQFTATMSGSTSTVFAWSLNAMMGTLTASGLYAAPAPIPSPQTITITAANVSDPTQFATATVSLVPDTVPPTVALTAPSNGSTVGGLVTVTASANDNVGVAGVQFLVDGVALGSKLTTGPYAASWDTSAFSNGSHTLSGVAQDAGGNTTATSTTTVTVSNVVTKVTVPVEVVGAAGTTQTVTVNVSSVVSGTQLWLQIHNLKYETEASVQINGGSWIPINTANSTLLGLASAYGGIGGGFSTLKLTLNVPDGLLVSGANTVSFRFNGTDGVTSGFRVLNLNFLAPDGTQLIDASTFVQDDPTTWQPPSTLAADIAAGKSLWQTASLVSSGNSIQATCSMCHAQDGRDLKYFNYSNNSIRQRAMFHGLTRQQGDQIASYIRSLNVPNPGRPWNPPYQPGPGLDSQPVENWAAGAGLGAVLNSDSEIQPYLVPGGSTSLWAANQYLNPRELPLAMQLPDWNSWLPAIHPVDAYGASFTGSTFNSLYSTLRSSLQPNDPTSYGNAIQYFSAWSVASSQTFFPPIEAAGNWDSNNNRQKLYSAALWQMVKVWEMNQEFGLESMPRIPYGTKANSRGWFGGQAFLTSPLMLHIPAGTGLGNGTNVSYEYLDYIWYHTQLLLNDGQGKQTDHWPIDYSYVEGVVKDLSLNAGGAPEAALELVWQIKALQEETLNGFGPEYAGYLGGFQPTAMSPVILVHVGWESDWSATSQTIRLFLTQAYVQAWFAQISSYTKTQYYQGADGNGTPWASASEDPATSDYVRQFGGQVWYMLPRLRYVGVDATLTSQIAAWAASLWPAGNWALNNSATCSGLGSCTSDR